MRLRGGIPITKKIETDMGLFRRFLEGMEAAVMAAQEELDLVVGETRKKPRELMPGAHRARPAFIVDNNAHGWRYLEEEDMYLLHALQPVFPLEA